MDITFLAGKSFVLRGSGLSVFLKAFVGLWMNCNSVTICGVGVQLVLSSYKPLMTCSLGFMPVDNQTR